MEPVVCVLAAGTCCWILWQYIFVVPFAQHFTCIFVQQYAYVFYCAGEHIEAQHQNITVFHYKLVMMITADWVCIFFEYFTAECHFIDTGCEVWHFYQTFGTDQNMTVWHTFAVECKVYTCIPAQIPFVVIACREGTHSSC